MAYVPNNNFNEQDQQDQQAQQQSIQQTGGTGATVGATGGQQTQQFNQPTQQGTGFTNLNRYLEQNQPQAQQMASNVASTVSQSGEQARQGVEQAQNQFNQFADQSTVNFDQDLFNRINEDAVGVAQDTDLFNQVAQQRQAQYTGPQDLQQSEFYQPARQQVQQAQQTAQKTTTDAGRKELTSQFNTGQTTAGMSSIDNLLLGGQQQRQILGEAREGLSDLDTRLMSANELAQQRAQEVAQTNQATREQAQNALQGSLQGFREDVDSRTAQTIEDARNAYGQMMATLQSGGQLTEEQIQMAGMTPEQYIEFEKQRQQFYNLGNTINPGSSLYVPVLKDYHKTGHSTIGVDQAAAAAKEANRQRAELQKMLNLYNNNPINYESYLSMSDPELSINRSNVATAEDYARQEALMQLMYGDPNSDLMAFGAEDLYLTNPELAGTANINTMNMDFGNLGTMYGQTTSALRDQQKRLEQSIKDAQKAEEAIRNVRNNSMLSRRNRTSGRGSGSR
jgi:hypothetical protein